MSFIRKMASNVLWRFVGAKAEEIAEIQRRNEVYEKELVKHSTPAPLTDYRQTVREASEVKLPRLPYNQFSFYFLRWQSTVLRAICLKIKQEIFRETRLKGLVWEPKFKLKCSDCQSEFQEYMNKCEICGSVELIHPNPHQKKLLAPFEVEANRAEQSFLSMCEEIEDDYQTTDDGYIVLLKDYFVAPNGEYFGKVREIMRGDPVRFRIVANEAGQRGNLWWVCLFHREAVYGEKGFCSECNGPLAEVYYIESEAGGTDPKHFYVKGEVIHASKYEPSRLYGISPIFSCWILARTIQLMDVFSEEIYEKGRLKGILGVTTDNRTALKKWWDDVMARLRKDQHYIPIVALDSGVDKGRGEMKFVKMFDSLKDMEFAPHKRMLKEEISGMFGVNLIFIADTSSSGGLNNEGLQIMVTNRTVEWGQAVWHDQNFPRLLAELGVTDWKLKLQSSKEEDEMAGLQRKDLEFTIAEKALRLGYDVKLVEDKFEISGQAQRLDQGSPFGADPRPRTPLLPTGSNQRPRVPAEEDGGKICPPGMVSTPENPRCHPIEWDIDKAEKGCGCPDSRESEKDFAKSIEAGREVGEEVQEVRNLFAKSIMETYHKNLSDRLEKLDDKSPNRVIKEVENIILDSQPQVEKQAFTEVIQAYKKGKEIDVAKMAPPYATSGETELLKTIALPQTLTDKFQASFGAFGLNKADWQVLRGIYRVNPFWKAFTGMSQSISDQLKSIITESYEAPNSARFQATLRDVKREYPDASKGRAEAITYGRLGKFSMAKIIEKMKRTVNAEVYRLERIARTETTGITAKGREIAFGERDPEGLFKFDWFGPQDQRTSDICTKIKAQVRVVGKGEGVALPVLKEIMQNVVEEETKGTKWKHREWVPHPNCRHVLRRTN